MKRAKPDICYLCGNLLCAPISVDHVPPKQLFAPNVRKDHSPQLLTISVHDACNKAYQFDEDYFVHTLMPFAQRTYAGSAIYSDVLAKFRAGKKVGLALGVLNEFDPTPSGLILPRGKVVKRFKGARVDRVIWKIIRGLYFHHHQVVLPERHPIAKILTPLKESEEPPDHFKVFMQNALTNNTDGAISHGKYERVFAYRFDRYADNTADDRHDIHYWALLIWDTILLRLYFMIQYVEVASGKNNKPTKALVREPRFSKFVSFENSPTEKPSPPAPRAVNSTPSAFITASVVFSVGLPLALNER